MAHTKTNDNVKLQSLELYSEMVNDMGDIQYFLKAVYEHETPYRKERLTIPKIYLPVRQKEVVVKHSCGIYDEVTADIGFGDLKVCRKDKVAYTVEVLEEYPQKMTLEEIEKKFGHKIELVSSK